MKISKLLVHAIVKVRKGSNHRSERNFQFGRFVPSLSKFIPEPLVDSYPSQYSFFQNALRVSASANVDCCL